MSPFTCTCMYHHLVIPFIIYAVGLIAGIVLSFAARTPTSRRGFRIFTAIVALPLVVGIISIAVVAYMWDQEPPDLQTLANRFPKQRQDLETILRMSDEDKHFTRIAPTFVDRDDDPGRYMQDDPKAGLSKARWDAYRALYKRNHIELGIQRNTVGDAFIMVDSVGLLNRGHTTGFLYCQPTSEGKERFHACGQPLNEGSHRMQNSPHAYENEAYSFRRLTGNWFAYDEGPS